MQLVRVVLIAVFVCLSTLWSEQALSQGSLNQETLINNITERLPDNFTPPLKSSSAPVKPILYFLLQSITSQVNTVTFSQPNESQSVFLVTNNVESVTNGSAGSLPETFLIAVDAHDPNAQIREIPFTYYGSDESFDIFSVSIPANTSDSYFWLVSVHRNPTGPTGLRYIFSDPVSVRSTIQNSNSNSNNSGVLSSPVVFSAYPPLNYWAINMFTGYNDPDGDDPISAPRGSELLVRYPGGSQRSLTAAAGLGAPRDANGFKDLTHPNAIAVGRFTPHPTDTNRGLVAIATGSSKWQVMEVVGLGPTDTPQFIPIPGQSTAHNNYDPIYDCHEPDRYIYYISDRVPLGADHIGFRRDEYDVGKVNSGVWQHDRFTNDIYIRANQPSGAYRPTCDSFGRILYRTWVRKTGDMMEVPHPSNPNDPYGLYGAFDNPSEQPQDFGVTLVPTHLHPEPHHNEQIPKSVNSLPSEIILDDFDVNLPMMFVKGGGETSINHWGRHNMFDYLELTQADGHTAYWAQAGITPSGTLPNDTFFNIRESFDNPGKILFISSAKAYKTLQSGRIGMMDVSPGQNADQSAATLKYITHPDSEKCNGPSCVGTNVGGWFAEPHEIDGNIIASWKPTADQPKAVHNNGEVNYSADYIYRPYVLKKNGQYYEPDQLLADPVNLKLRFAGGETYNGEASIRFLSPVKALPLAPKNEVTVDVEVLQAFNSTGVNVNEFQQYLRDNNLALIVGRDVTQREVKDIQQPYNIKVSNSSHQTIGDPGGPVYEAKYLRIFQGDHRRGYFNKQGGRRILPTPLHDDGGANLPSAPSAPQGTVAIRPDGSYAAIVPARRSLSWELALPTGEGFVRERLWLTFEPGEVVFCKTCHGLDTVDQAGNTAAPGAGQAVSEYLNYWKDNIRP